MTHGLPAGIGRPATSAFLEAGYANLEQLSRARETDLAKLHGVGPKALRIIKTALAEQGVSFADERC